MTLNRERAAWLLLAPLLVASVIGACIVPFHSPTSLDSRTHVEMIRGIVDHGLPWNYNGPIDKYEELQIAWNVGRDGKSWGTYPPVFAYLAVPAFVVDGLRGVSRFVFLTGGVLAFLTFLLGRRFTGDPLTGTAAAWLTILATPVGASLLDIGPYALCVTFVALAVLLALRSLDDAAKRRSSLVMAFLAGLSAALASGTHMLSLPMALALIGLLGVLPGEGERIVLPAAIARHAPPMLSDGSIRRGAIAAAGAAIPLIAIGALNHLRFGSWNPASYGPCAWVRRCEAHGLAKQTAGAMVAFAGPVLVFIAALTVVVWLLRRSPAKMALAAGGGLLLLFFIPGLDARARSLFDLLLAYTVDVGFVDMAPFPKAADGLGTLWGPRVVKAPFQGTPVLALALVAPWLVARRARTLLLLGPSVGLFALLAMRALIPPLHALGFPWLYLRYVMPALPLLVVATLAVARELKWEWRHAVVIGAVAIAVGLWLGYQRDLPWYQRAFILRVTLLAAFGSIVFVLLSHRFERLVRWSRIFVGASVAFSFAICTGIDFCETAGARKHNDRRVDELAAVAPARFALVARSGADPDLDIPLGLRASRDIEAADLLESDDWTHFRILIDRWSDDHRPIYMLGPPGLWRSPWPDVVFEPVDEKKTILLVKRIR